MVVALIALFVALGGSASAIVISGKVIKNNSVTGTDLKNRSVKGRDIARNTLGGDTVKESKLGLVPKAKDAATVGGKTPDQIVAPTKATCPPGTIEHAGACPEVIPRPDTTWGKAMEACAAANRRLISPGEAYTLRRRFAPANVPGDEHTDEWIGFNLVIIVTGNGFGSGRRDTSLSKVRCVAPLRS